MLRLFRERPQASPKQLPAPLHMHDDRRGRMLARHRSILGVATPTIRPYSEPVLGGHGSAFSRLVVAGAVIAALMVVPAGMSRQTVDIPPTQVLLAFDTTGSMTPAIAASKAGAERIISSVAAASPGARFAVASFRDRYYAGGEYTLEQPLTTRAAAVVAAIRRLHAVKTLDVAKDTDAEAYNLLFHKTYSDGRIGWRAGGRKIVIVVGDAEPHSAGADGIPGCADTTHDWNGLDTAHELSLMNRAKITLVMIRQASTATTTLECYASLAARAYAGGAAVDGGTSSVAATVLELVKGAYAPFDVTPQLSSAVAGKTTGVTVRFANPNSFPLTLSDLSLALPANLTYEQGSATGSLGEPDVAEHTLTWQPAGPLAAYAVATAHLVLRISGPSSSSLTASATATAPDGTATPVKASAVIAVVAQPRTALLSIDGRSGPRSVLGVFSAPLGSTVSRHGSGTFSVRLGAGRSLTIRPLSAASRVVGAPSVIDLRGQVARAVGLSSCKTGAAVRTVITDSDALTSRGKTNDALALTLPRSCGGSLRFADTAGSLSVTLAYH
jgi:hypothetical protein